MDPRRFIAMERRRAMTPIEALMICPPGIEPQDDVAGGGALRTIIDLALNDLDQHEAPKHKGRMRFVVEACVFERRSLREVGRAMGLSKTHVARIRDQALALLRDALKNDTHIREALHGQ